MEEGSTLKLIMEKGPREGETIEFPPGSIICLGRVVRGNSLTIKDSGISSKHLSIHFEPDSGKWVLLDLDSSNGTFLNGTKLLPQIPYPLSDGDTIKVGEYSSIIVRMVAAGSIQVRRNPRRRAAVEDDVISESQSVMAESSELVLDLNGELRNNGAGKPRRGRPRKGMVLKNEVQKSSVEVENVMEMDNVGSIESNQGRQMRTRRTRESKKEESAKFDSVLGEIPENRKMMPKGLREKKIIEDETLKSLDKGFSEKEEAKENLVTGLSEEVQVVKVLEQKEAKESAVNGLSEQVPVVDIVEHKEVEENLVNELSEGVQVVDLEQKEASASRAKEDFADIGEEPDLEKMTLGEWFDYLEMYLPKQIYVETEEIITGMRQRAEQFQEYMLQQKSAMEKGKSPMA